MMMMMNAVVKTTHSSETNHVEQASLFQSSMQVLNLHYFNNLASIEIKIEFIVC
jgi:hypothetical protein